jgi:hypothetical protein
MTDREFSIQPEDLLRWFRQGADTNMLSDLLGVPESKIANMLARAREDERNQADPSFPSKRQPPVENN